METWQIILLGAIQGITEFLPVSSSGHLILAPRLFDFADQGLALDALLHLATLIVIIIFFKNELIKLLQGLMNRKDSTGYRGLAWSILVSSFPAGLAGLILGNLIEEKTRTPYFVGANLIFWSIILLVADWKGKLSKNSTKKILLIGYLGIKKP